MAGERVCVLGAGVAGLAAAKVLQGDGFEVSVFEKEASLGGVWCESRTYPGLRTNDPRDFYAYSDHPYPPSTDAYPTAAQVRTYLRSYAEHFEIADRIRFDTEVVRAARRFAEDGSEAGWQVTVRDGASPDRAETLEFDFLVVCNGVFSEPSLPEVEGQEQFSGVAGHSSDFDPELARGKRIVVVGSSKSGLDLASWAAEEGASCTLVFRNANWMLPRFFFGWINTQWVILTRLFEAFGPYVRPTRFEDVLHRFGAPLVRAFWRGLTAILRRELSGAGPLIPEEPLPARGEDLAVGTDVYEQVRRGKVRPERSPIRRFPGGSAVELEDGTMLEADVVLFATGFRQSMPFLEDDVRDAIDRKEGFRLYRLILPPDVARLGFLGYNASFSTPLTCEIAAHWLSQSFRGELRLSGREEMEREIERFRDWIGEVMPRFRRGFFVGPFIAHYSDDLLREMGLRTTRTSNFLTENFVPNWPERYRTLQVERERARSGAAPDRGRFYFSALHALALLSIAVGVSLVW